jgi:hypothetical protein
MRPNTADVDCKIVFQRGHRMFNKGMKMYGPTKEIEEKKETVNNHPPMKRAGTSNLLFRKTSKNGKRNTEFNQNQENNVKPGGFHVNLFEKYQNFLVIFFFRNYSNFKRMKKGKNWIKNSKN